MPNTKITREKFKNHLHYGKNIYIALLLAAFFVGDILYTVTTYKAPNERNVQIELVGNYSETDKEEPVLIALEAGQAYERARDEAAGIDVNSPSYEPALQEVEFISLPYDPSGEESEAYYGYQKYSVTLASAEGDIFILDSSLLDYLLSEGLLVDLTPYIESGVLTPGEQCNVAKGTYAEFVPEGEAPTGRNCVYALQADSLLGLYDTFMFNPTGKYMVVLDYSLNQDTSVAVMQSLIEQFDQPEEYVELQKRRAEAAEQAKLEEEAKAAEEANAGEVGSEEGAEE